MCVASTEPPSPVERDNCLVTRSQSAAHVVRAGIALLGLVCGTVVWSLVHGSGTFTTYAGRSDLAATLFVAAGLGLIAAGLITALRRPRIGGLAVLAGFVWFTPVLDGWEGGPATVREIGFLASSLAFPMLLHLVIRAVPMTGRAASLVSMAYALFGLCAVVLVLVRDPFFDPHCWVNCTTNLFVVESRPWLAGMLVTASRWIAAGAAVALIAVCVNSSVQSTSRHRYGPLLLGGVVLGLATLAHSLITIRHGFEDPSAQSMTMMFAGSCIAVVLIAGGLLWSPLYSRHVRRAVARVVATLDDAPEVGSLQAALAQVTRDPNLRVSYWLPELARYSDAHGQSVDEPMSSAAIIASPVMRDGQRIAVISHSGDAAELDRALGSDLRLALDNERLQAEVFAQINDLRESRARIVAVGDERRRGLERDLHDGAQQTLLGLSYDLRVALAAAATNQDGELTAVLDSALAEVAQAFVELRELAHGIFPAVLTQAGLGAAIASLAETSEIAVDVDCTITERLPTDVETAVYVVVADGLQAATESEASSTEVTIARRNGHVVVDVTPDRTGAFTDMTHVADRVGAVGGTLQIDTTGMRAEIPCAS